MLYSRKIFPSLLALAALAILTGCSLAEDITPPPNYKSPTAPQSTAAANVYPLLPPDPAHGAQIYASNCLPCHGQSGLGDGPQAANLPNPPAAIGSPDLARASVPADWYNIISQGNLQQFMPGFSGSLSDQDRWDVLAYVYTLSAPSDQVQQGAQVFQQQCTDCHGTHGKGDGVQAASLAVKPNDLTNPALLGQISLQAIYQDISAGISPAMPAFSSTLNDTQLWAVASYVRSLGFATSGSLAAAATSMPTTGSPGLTATPVPGTTLPAGTAQATPAAATAAAPSGSGTPAMVIGNITGKVTNGSGGALPSGLTAILQGYDNMQLAVSQSMPVAGDGSYGFSQIEMPSGRVFVVTVNYNGNSFSSDVAHPTGTATTLDLPVTIYNATTDTSALVVDRLHVFMDFSKPGVLQVIELFVITNPTNKIVIPPASGQPVLTYALPKDATNLQFQDSTIGQRYVTTQDGFGDTQPIQPGVDQFQVMFAYDLAYTDKIDLSLPVNKLPVNAAVIMIENPGVRLSSSLLQDSGEQSVQGMNFHMYSADNLTAGSSLNMTLSGSPSASGQTGGSNSATTNIMIGVAILAVAMIITGLWLYFGRRPAPKLATEAAGETTHGLEISSDADTLMDAIAALDDLYRAGDLPQDAYQKRRAELKARLVEIFKEKGE
jgi:mono/diheme cytochrome c family protein